MWRIDSEESQVNQILRITGLIKYEALTRTISFHKIFYSWIIDIISGNKINIAVKLKKFG
jgi:hypothetical protein